MLPFFFRLRKAGPVQIFHAHGDILGHPKPLAVDASQHVQAAGLILCFPCQPVSLLVVRRGADALQVALGQKGITKGIALLQPQGAGKTGKGPDPILSRSPACKQIQPRRIVSIRIALFFYGSGKALVSFLRILLYAPSRILQPI